MTDSPSLVLPPTPQPQARAWREAFARISSTTPPCPGLNLKKWPEMHTVALRSPSDHADRAAELGWTTEELFGVHPEIGATRVDACGALMISGGQPVVSVEKDRVCFGGHELLPPGRSKSLRAGVGLAGAKEAVAARASAP